MCVCVLYIMLKSLVRRCCLLLNGMFMSVSVRVVLKKDRKNVAVMSVWVCAYICVDGCVTSQIITPTHCVKFGCR